MILDEKKDDQVEVSGTTENFEFVISNDAVISDILSNRIYSDKTLAVIREYACNALDANIDNGKREVPIIVTLPTELNPIFSIRDSGKGLTHDEVKRVFVSYGTSTKRASNTSIGMFGIGCKSGFAYGDAFIVSSIQNGIRNDYSAFKDNKVPKMSLLGSAPTTEQDGIEIQIPVRMEDIESFKSKCRDFFRYWLVKPEIRGGEIEFKNDEVFLSGKNWNIYALSGSSYGNRLIAVMGNVPYPVDLNALSIPYQSPLHKFSSYPITIELPIGSLSVNAGREGLEYDDKTKKNIIALIEEIWQAISGRIEKEFEGCTSMFEAKIKMQELYAPSSPLRKMIESFDKNDFKWQGKKIGGPTWTNVSSTYDDLGFKSQTFQSGRGYYGSQKRPSSQQSGSFEASREVLYVINDENAQHGILNRIAPLLDTDGTSALNCLQKKYSSVYLIQVTDDTTWTKWKTERFFDAPTVNFSTLKKVKLKDVYGGGIGDSISVEAHKTKVFTVDFDCTRERMKRDYFKAADVDLMNESALYVVIDRFFVNVPTNSKIFARYGSSDGIDPRKMIDFVRELCQLKTPKGFPVRFPTVYAVREKDKAKLGPKMKCFFAMMEKQTFAAIENPVIMAASAERSVACSMESGMFSFLRDKVVKKLAPDHPLNAIFAEHKKMLHEDKIDKIVVLESFARRYNISMSKNFKSDLPVRFQNIVKTYPMLTLVQMLSSYQWDSHIGTTADYMMAIDKSKEVPEVIEEH